MSSVSLRVNGATHTVDVDPATPLLYVLRNDLGLRGPRFGCGLAQCGYCQNGQIMTAKALLDRNPHPTDAEIRDGMEGVLCRCMTYYRIQSAIKRVAHGAAASAKEGGK